MTQEVHDPLADTLPPRYAVESDDEDEHYPLSGLSTRSEQLNVWLKANHDLPCRRPLIFASGEAGTRWAKIIDFGGQRVGNIYVNDLPAGLVFCPSWTSAVIVVSEAENHVRLPLFAMTTYTTAIIDRLQPTSVAILDSYSTKTYVSAQVISQDTAPIRYLSIGKKPVSDSGLELFAPPNLLQSTAASLLNVLLVRSLRGESTGNTAATILLPSAKMSRPPPVAFNGSGVNEDFAGWDKEMLEKAHRWLFETIGEDPGVSSLLARAEPVTRPAGVARPSFVEVGEGGMYI